MIHQNSRHGNAICVIYADCLTAGLPAWLPGCPVPSAHTVICSISRAIRQIQNADYQMWSLHRSGGTCLAAQLGSAHFDLWFQQLDVQIKSIPGPHSGLRLGSIWFSFNSDLQQMLSSSSTSSRHINTAAVRVAHQLIKREIKLRTKLPHGFLFFRFFSSFLFLGTSISLS